MNRSTVLITGGYGCIGAETTKWFLKNTDASVVIASRSVSAGRTNRVFDGYELDRLTAVSLDVSQPEAIVDLLVRHAFTHVIHLAALQTPDCNANPDLGLQVNLAGTQHLLEALKRSGRDLQRFVFASSIAVYGPRPLYPSGTVPSDSGLAPSGPYGIWKLAGEHLSRLFHEQTGVPTICLRPAVLYGPGRDIGLTSSPTTAMKHVVQRLPYEIPFWSTQDYQFAPDVGAATAISASEKFEGFGTYTMPSHTLSSQQMADVICEVAEQVEGLAGAEVSVGEQSVPFICDLEYESFLKRFPNTPHSSIRDGVLQTLSTFLRQHQKGWLVPEA